MAQFRPGQYWKERGELAFSFVVISHTHKPPANCKHLYLRLGYTNASRQQGTKAILHSGRTGDRDKGRPNARLYLFLGKAGKEGLIHREQAEWGNKFPGCKGTGSIFGWFHLGITCRKKLLHQGSITMLTKGRQPRQRVKVMSDW